MKQQNLTTKILLPIDGSENSRRALKFAGQLGSSLGKSLSGITLFHVAAGGYMSHHLGYIDFWAMDLTQSEAFQKQYFNEKVKPLLEEGERILKESGIKVEIEKQVADGDPAREIVQLANKENFSTIIMARRGLSEIKGFFLGSVSSGVVHTASRQTVYIVGHKVLEDNKCPIPRILIPVDGSPYSMKGVEHAVYLSSRLEGITKITLLKVINLALYIERLKEGVDHEDEAQRILEDARTVFLRAGISEGLIDTRVEIGIPYEEILREAEEGNYNLIIMGRKGRSAIKDLLLGGVSPTVLQRCQNPTVAIVSGE
ncbi:MAG: universal stress protein [Thermodesulfobacteriota bacterium]